MTASSFSDSPRIPPISSVVLLGRDPPPLRRVGKHPPGQVPLPVPAPRLHISGAESKFRPHSVSRFRKSIFKQNHFNLQDPIHVWSGGLDATLRTADINSSTETVVGNHDNAIRSDAIRNSVFTEVIRGEFESEAVSLDCLIPSPLAAELWSSSGFEQNASRTTVLKF